MNKIKSTQIQLNNENFDEIHVLSEKLVEPITRPGAPD